MKKIWDSIAKDLWIVLLDIIALNASYFLALLIRFYVNGEFRATVNYLIGDWAKFAPFYTIISLIIFACFKLYGGMWRYAGINERKLNFACAGRPERSQWIMFKWVISDAKSVARSIRKSDSV